jgi:8-oxo-dGTP pyrophosphatase MutT (NUDIX family)
MTQSTIRPALLNLIESYNPFNEQEAKDKEVFLKYINTFDDVLTRDNEFGHFCSSAFIVNPARDKVLMVHHNIYDAWTWIGGHADGESDFLAIALRETEEETGIKNARPLGEDIFVIDTLPVHGHFKNGKYVPAHIHLSIGYLFEADEDETLQIQEEENSGVKWVSLEDVLEVAMYQPDKPMFQKCINKLKLLKEEK